MGEIIKKYGKIEIGNQEFDIELNKPHFINGEKSIHIQNNKFRLEMPASEFSRMAAAVIFAKKQFDKLKEEADEQSGGNNINQNKDMRTGVENRR